MSELNERQKELTETTDGFVVVDAGPGTGKTHTIVRRYTNLISMNINPMDILMITFTRNAAQEMRDRISSVLLDAAQHEQDLTKKEAFQRSVKNVKTTTFDSLCIDIVQNSPEYISEFFETKDMLSRKATIVENETLNEEYFAGYYDRFIKEKGKRYAKRGYDPAALVGEHVNDVYEVINQLMARGVIPKQYEWFGDGEKVIKGDVDSVRDKILSEEKNVQSEINKIIKDDNTAFPAGKEFDEIASMVAEEDRFLLNEFIRDVYYGYICESIKDNRLTFGLAELFAFAVLSEKRDSKDLHSVRYMIIDEFQDTNELQMKICLMLLKEPNLCAVGDWKQGIFGFRFVSIENITRFKERLKKFKDELECCGMDIPFDITEPTVIEFDKNYRSSQVILDRSFESLDIEGSDKEVVVHDPAVALESVNNELYGENTHFQCIQSDSKEEEIDAVVSRIIEYRNSDRYKVVCKEGDEKKTRSLDYGDIAVLCRTSTVCRKILDRCKERGVPAFFQGDLEVMNSREGKLALAWLRYVNNANDSRGLIAILADRGYPLSEINSMCDSTYRKNIDGQLNINAPKYIVDQRNWLLKKRRRPNDLLTSIFEFYGLDNDVTQSIIRILSSAYTGSLLTISDLIRLIEEDIDKATKYNIDPSLDMKAVTIQTMHKSKGLEYPAVIVAGIDQSTMPLVVNKGPMLVFNDRDGIRCKKEYVCKDDGDLKHEAIVDSWRYRVLKSANQKDYSEERRLLFVAMTRAKQYLTLTAGNKPSKFFSHYFKESAKVEEFETSGVNTNFLVDRPNIEGYERRRSSLSAHDLMDTLDIPIRSEDIKGKGTEYGERVHKAAYLMARGFKSEDSFPETEQIQRILSDLKGAKLYPELKCVLPAGGVSINGTIDLLAEFDDRIEIHDYKTDIDDHDLERYVMQLSVYAHAAETLGKPIRCFVDFLSIPKQTEISILPMERIEATVRDYFMKIQDQS